jgi:hypothetical protein
MKTSVLEKPARSTDQTRTQSTEHYWTETDKIIQCDIRDITVRAEKRIDSDEFPAALELANSTKDAWLVAHSQKLRTPLVAITSMLSLMELGHNLASVRPLYEQPSDFDETAFRLVRKNFQRLVTLFNELADLTGQSPLSLESRPSPRTETSLTTPISLDWRG